MKLFTAFIILITSSFLSNAGLIATADGALDTENNIEWMDFTRTTGLSYFETLGEFSSGGSFEGWRFATKEDVLALFSSAGALNKTFDDDYSPDGFNGASELIIDLLGQNFGSDGLYRAVLVSYTGAGFPVSFPELAGFFVFDLIPNDLFNILRISEAMFATGDGESQKSLGLVRDYVVAPEPSIFAIFTLAFLSLFLMRYSVK